MGLSSDKIFDAIKRVSKDPEKALNPEAIKHAHMKGWINQWEHDFYFDTWRKRKLSPRLRNKRIQINRQVLAGVRNAEDLGFLSGLLDRHPKLILDTSATKWMIRELSKHDTDELVSFLDRYSGRILFGSDIVTSDDHLTTDESETPGFGDQLAGSDHEAFELYASRYWALRTMYETDYRGESNIADPDLMMVDPNSNNEMSAPELKGHGLNAARLKMLYRDAVVGTLDRWYQGDNPWADSAGK